MEQRIFLSAPSDNKALSRRAAYYAHVVCGQIGRDNIKRLGADKYYRVENSGLVLGTPATEKVDRIRVYVYDNYKCRVMFYRGYEKWTIDKVELGSLVSLIEKETGVELV